MSANQHFRVVVRHRDPERPGAALRCDCAGGCAGPGIEATRGPTTDPEGLERETFGLTELVSLPAKGVGVGRWPESALPR